MFFFHTVPARPMVHEDGMDSGVSMLGAWYMVGGYYAVQTRPMVHEDRMGQWE